MKSPQKGTMGQWLFPGDRLVTSLKSLLFHVSMVSTHSGLVDNMGTTSLAFLALTRTWTPKLTAGPLWRWKVPVVTTWEAGDTDTVLFLSGSELTQPGPDKKIAKGLSSNADLLGFKCWVCSLWAVWPWLLISWGLSFHICEMNRYSNNYALLGEVVTKLETVHVSYLFTVPS
jgi:hypothetical protein